MNARLSLRPLANLKTLFDQNLQLKSTPYKEMYQMYN